LAEKDFKPDLKLFAAKEQKTHLPKHMMLSKLNAILPFFFFIFKKKKKKKIETLSMRCFLLSNDKFSLTSVSNFSLIFVIDSDGSITTTCFKESNTIFVALIIVPGPLPKSNREVGEKSGHLN
jgi:hypothetical protein